MDEKDLDKLGTVLAMTNYAFVSTIEQLNRQQKRQTWIIYVAMTALIMAFVLVGWTVHRSYETIDALSGQIEQNRIMIKSNAEVLQHGRITQTSEASSE